MNEIAFLPAIDTAELNWRDGQPVCQRFGDVYFNCDNGLAEARHVFIRQNRLAERFDGVGSGQHFVVAETGFGTGLNFLATCQVWLDKDPPAGSCLHFISVERFPFKKEDLKRALSLWPELHDLATELLDLYPAPVRGVHRLVLAGGRIRLTLFFGDALDAWNSLEFTADAWFLDGFAPARNPKMWQQEMAQAVANHSGPGTTMATFTAAGLVRRQFSEAGFVMSTTAGYARKRDMLVGHFKFNEDAQTRPAASTKTVGIIGAGIAGTTLAANLAKRGFDTTLIEKAGHAASAASGNSQGALYVKLGVDYNDQTELALGALLFAQRFYSGFQACGWNRTGLIQLAYNASEADRQSRFLAKNRYPSSVVEFVDSKKASELAGVSVPYSGLWFPFSGWLEPAKICRQLASQPKVSKQFGFEVSEIRRSDQGWQVYSSHGQSLTFDHIVLCAGAESPDIIPGEEQFRIKKIRGQVTEVPNQYLDAPSLVLCGPGYVNPVHQQRSTVGATFDLRDQSEKVSGVSDQENLQMLDTLLPGTLRSENAEIQSEVTGRVAFRCATHDYQPIAGPLKARDGKPFEGMYLFTGLGSKGLTYSTLLAEYLADVISGQPLCLPKNLIRRIETKRCYRPEVTNS